ncbi:acetyl-CoA C-acetyltransferase [Salipiger thiooxidans]|uniref:Acetyl-CoA C-acetyltransferase n=1 Tax=Salipiger thiooxidans TaxID=282683 RepID=A0A1G7LJN6_9RHOB|nr:acetyl-CoA C-acetyltransferase [Salipiger thiooxidans]SDF49661.1 acetyl-CoA C-acetyltransferase [Salipiger thiooxidans]
MSQAYIFDAIRTPRGRGKAGGGLHEVDPISLVARLLNALEARHALDTGLVDDVVLGCAQPRQEQGGDIARTAVLMAGWNSRVPGTQINRYCGSAIESLAIAAQKVMSGWERLVLAGGVESMSRVRMGGAPGASDTLPDLSFKLRQLPTGVAADLIASLDGLTRADVDAYALQSHQRAAQAQAEGRFDRSIVPVTDESGLVILDRDETVRPDTSLDKLAALAPSFEQMGKMGFDAVALSRYPQVAAINHIHTSGNSSGVVDGASLVMVGSREMGEKLGLTPRARVVSAAAIGDEPTIMLSAPAPSTELALSRAGMTLSDVDLFEVNEAFSSVVLRFAEATGVDMDRINVNGGAIALGHPLGATGGMLVGTLLDELERADKQVGVVTACVMGGMGSALVLERV